ncbi:MAG: hypothetical protein ACJAT4_003261 [Granulosicoccus sp.]|jgi:uncharacterized protein (DUF2147 family)
MTMTLKSTFTTILFFTLFISSSVAQSCVGIWKTIDDETGEEQSQVEIYEKSGKYYGKIIKLINPTTDVCNTCTGDREGNFLVGMEILWDMEKSGSTWKNGEIFSPTKDKTYSCKLWLEGKDILKVRGYVALFYRTQTWHRIK